MERQFPVIAEEKALTPRGAGLSGKGTEAQGRRGVLTLRKRKEIVR